MSEQFTNITLGGKPCLEADHAAFPLARRANSFYLPLGPEPGVARVLMRHEDINALMGPVNGSASAGYLPLIFKTGPSPTTELRFPKMYIGDARRMTSGPEASPNAPVLVTLYDKRYLAKQFSPPSSLSVLRDAGTPPADPTWAECAQALWEEMSYLGSWPGLPYTPTNKPATLRWLGLTCWEALSILLDYIQCAVAYNPFTDALSIVKLGAAQSIPYPANMETYRTRTLQGKASVFPEKVRVQFPGGTTTLNTSITGAQMGTFKTFIEHVSASNGTVQTNRATELRDNYLADQQVVNEKRVYRGLLNGVLLGGQVKAVQWLNYGPRPGTLEGGFRTELLTHPGLPSPVKDCSHAMPQLWGTLDGALAQGSSATMSIFWKEAGSWTDTGVNVTVHDRLLKSRAPDMNSGKWVQADWKDDAYYATSAECN